MSLSVCGHCLNADSSPRWQAQEEGRSWWMDHSPDSCHSDTNCISAQSWLLCSACGQLWAVIGTICINELRFEIQQTKGVHPELDSSQAESASLSTNVWDHEGVSSAFAINGFGHPWSSTAEPWYSSCGGSVDFIKIADSHSHFGL